MEGGGYRLRFLAVVVLPAAVLMALEIVSSRLLAPAFGNSVYVWGSIIGVFLAAMSGGYVLGGGYADRRPELPAVGRLLLLAALFQWTTALFGRQFVAAIGGWTEGRPAGTLVAAALTFGPATLLLATVSPFAVRLAGLDRTRLGNVSGRLFALSTAGSLAGTLCATFVLIPRLELDAILMALVAITALAAALAGGRRWSWGAALVAVAASFGTVPHPGWSPKLVERATPYQMLEVLESDGRRFLISDGTPHGGFELATGNPTERYVYAAETLRLFTPEPREALLLGLGSGAVGKMWTKRFPELSATYVEVDPAVAEIAERYFDFRPGPDTRLVLDDARRYVATATGRWDWIYCDTYIGHSVPFHLATREFFEELANHLTPDGVVGMNLAGDASHPFSRAIYRTLRQVFDQVEIFSVHASSNFLLVARRGPPLSASELDRRALELDRTVAPPPGGTRFVEIARYRLAREIDLADVPVLRDSYAPVDALLDLASDRPALPGAGFEGGEERR